MEKKKLFISVPMNGFKEDDILKMRQYLKDTAEVYFGEQFEVLDTYRVVPIVKNGVKNERIYMLGDTIKNYLSEADYYIGIFDSDCIDYSIKGCLVENTCWRVYHLGEKNALYCDYSIMLKNLKIRKKKVTK